MNLPRNSLRRHIGPGPFLRPILFPADIQEPAERELLKHPGMLRSDILVAPHHGSAESTTPQFIAAIRPKIILASNDARLSTKQRKFDAEESAWPIYRTSRCGAITIKIEPGGEIHVRPFLRRTAREYSF